MNPDCIVGTAYFYIWGIKISYPLQNRGTQNKPNELKYQVNVLEPLNTGFVFAYFSKIFDNRNLRYMDELVESYSVHERCQKKFCQKGMKTRHFGKIISIKNII